MNAEHRLQPRVSGYAKALLVGPNTPGYIRNLSRTGCQVAFVQTVEAATGDLIKVRVIAEHDPAIPQFQISLRVRRIKPDALWCVLGGEIEAVSGHQDKKVFEKLVDYYAGAGA
jgi:hypothetical protein